MPTQLPLESTDLFGDLLFPHTYDIIQSDAMKPLENHKFSFPVQSSIVASNGNLTDNFQYISELREASIRYRHKSDSSSIDGRKQVLVLGAGMVCAPFVEYLYRDEKIFINVCSQFKDEADRIANRFPGIRSTYLNVNENPNNLRELCTSSDVVVSLLPYALHGIVAEKCIEAKTNMVTASYITDHVRSLDQLAKEAGVTILNEVGLDPGIDHFLALEQIKDIQEKDGTIESLISYCGGLPAPECSNNPLRYKFSWSPRGVLANTLSPARYINRGQIVEILGGGDLMSAPKDLNFLPGFALEGFPNRDSTKYGELYKLGPNVSTLLRGTIRYKGFSECIQAIQFIGLIDTEPHPMLHPNGPEITWRQLIVNMMGLTDPTIFFENLKQKLSERIPLHVDCIEQLGLLDETPVVKLNTPLDTLCNYLSKRLAFGDDERDIVILRHEFIVRWPDHTREEKGVNFVVYGEPASRGGHSAMALTVGYPTAIATKMILDGEIQERGVVLPFEPDVFMPMLSRLRAEGFTTTHTSRIIN